MTGLDKELLEFRFKFLAEEMTEWKDSGDELLEILSDEKVHHGLVANRLEDQLDAMVDLIYVALGNVVLQGMAPVFIEAWRRVHEANMKKVRAQSAEESKRGSTFDVVKPPGWTPPSHSDLVKDHAHRSA